MYGSEKRLIDSRHPLAYRKSVGVTDQTLVSDTTPRETWRVVLTNPGYLWTSVMDVSGETRDSRSVGAQCMGLESTGGWRDTQEWEMECVWHSNTRNIQERSGKTHPIKNDMVTHKKDKTHVGKTRQCTPKEDVCVSVCFWGGFHPIWPWSRTVRSLDVVFGGPGRVLKILWYREEGGGGGFVCIRGPRRSGGQEGTSPCPWVKCHFSKMFIINR